MDCSCGRVRLGLRVLTGIVVGEVGLVGAVGVHHVYLTVAVAVGQERYPALERDLAWRSEMASA